MTPLQVVIAEKILEKYQDEDFYKVMVLTNLSSKYLLYKERFFKKNKYNLTILSNSTNKISILINWLAIRLKFLFLPNFDKVFFANVNSPEIQLMLSSIKFKELYTFDDGTANLVESSPLYKESTTGKLGNIFLNLLNNNYSSRKIRKESKRHFSIYKNRNNILSSEYIEYITLFKLDNYNSNYFNAKRNISIFLGQPIYELLIDISECKKNDKNIYFSKLAIENFRIDFYYPHPREKYRIDNVEYIVSDLVFEDYLLSILEYDTNYTIYTFFSSAVLPFTNLSNVKIVSLKPKDYPDYLHDNYQLMRDFGIDVIEI